MNLNLKHRPIDWAEVIGQEAAVSKLSKKLSKQELPNVVLFDGPTGTGKTTLARILSSKLGVKPEEGNPNYIEKNCADCRGIDDVREIGDDMKLAAWGGKARVWVLDEVVQLPTATQQAMLKMLEDTPAHVYFFLCTSDKGKLLDTLTGRCFPVTLKKLTRDAILNILISVLEKEDREISPKVSKAIADKADGSARMALQLLESVLALSGEQLQLESLDEGIDGTMGYQLAQALIYKKDWASVEKVLEQLLQEHETVRRVVLRYCETVMLGKSEEYRKVRASSVITALQFAFTDSGKAGLINACWKLCHAK